LPVTVRALSPRPGLDDGDRSSRAHVLILREAYPKLMQPRAIRLTFNPDDPSSV